MLRKISALLCFTLTVLFSSVNAFAIDKLQLVFIEPDVSADMAHLNWSIPALKEWRRRPQERVNNDLDGKFNLTVKIVNVPKNLIGEVPRMKLCPIPQSPDRCWEQEVLSPINKEGIFKCNVYFRLSNWDKHIFRFKIGDDKYEIVIDEDKF